MGINVLIKSNLNTVKFDKFIFSCCRLPSFQCLFIHNTSALLFLLIIPSLVWPLKRFFKLRNRIDSKYPSVFSVDFIPVAQLLVVHI